MAGHEGWTEMYAVVHGRYKPTEIDSMWEQENEATERATKLGCSWRVVKWKVRSSNIDDGANLKEQVRTFWFDPTTSTLTPDFYPRDYFAADAFRWSRGGN